MIDHALEKKFAYPAINVTSLTTANGVLKGLAESRSDGIIMMKNYDGVLKIEGDVGNKKKYDPRSYMKLGEAAWGERVKQAVADLRGVGTSLFKSGS